MGQICFYSGVNKRLYNAAHVWMGSTRGGLAMATILACAGFSAISGSNTATAATMSTVALPEMKKFGYSPVLSTGSVAVGSTLGVLIPPSVVLIVIGLQTGLSIARLFWASFIPGLVLAGLFILTIWFICRQRPDWGPGRRPSTLKEKFASLPGSIEMLILFALVMGGLFAGFFTPSEAGAAGSALAILIAIAGRHLTLKNFIRSVADTIRVSSMILVIVMGAVIFGRFLAITRLPFTVAEAIGALAAPAPLMLTLILFIYIIGGMVMDALALLLITIPIFFPLAEVLGYNPIWFAVLINIVTTLGAVTPPVGVTAFIVASMDPTVSLAKVFRGVSYFFLAYVMLMILMFLFPGLALFLPGLINS